MLCYCLAILCILIYLKKRFSRVGDISGGEPGRDQGEGELLNLVGELAQLQAVPKPRRPFQPLPPGLLPGGAGGRIPLVGALRSPKGAAKGLQSACSAASLARRHVVALASLNGLGPALTFDKGFGPEAQGLRNQAREGSSSGAAPGLGKLCPVPREDHQRLPIRCRP